MSGWFIAAAAGVAAYLALGAVVAVVVGRMIALRDRPYRDTPNGRMPRRSGGATGHPLRLS